MADLAKRLAGPTLVPSAGAVLYTVPASTLTIVRNIHVSNTQSAAANTNSFSFGIGTAGVIAAGGQLFGNHLVGPAGVLNWSTFLVLVTGEQLIVVGGTNNVLNITVSGVEVS